VLDRANKDDKEASILQLSRGTSIILLVLYVIYLVFQLYTHANLFSPAPVDRSTAGASDESPAADADSHDSHDDEYHMSVLAAMSILVIVTVLVSVCADYLVDSIDEIVASGRISKNFIGLILIPIVGNAAEHVTACVVAVRNKMDLAMSVAIGSSIQIALLVTPFLVVLGWLVLDQPMSLHFETFETVAFALSVLVVTYTVQDGKSNYLEGAMVRCSSAPHNSRAGAPANPYSSLVCMPSSPWPSTLPPRTLWTRSWAASQPFGYDVRSRRAPPPVPHVGCTIRKSSSRQCGRILPSSLV